MLLTEKVKIKVNCKNIRWYEEKGYEIPRYYSKKHKRNLVRRGTEIEVYVKDLTLGSHVKVEVSCDYCNCRKVVRYRDYIKNHDEELGDCCIKCRTIKIENTMMNIYGVSNGCELPWTLEKTKETNKKRYGTEWGMQSDIVRNKSKQTMLDKYGVERPLQVEAILAKMISTRHKNLSNPTSKPQLNLYNLLKSKYINTALEVPCGRYSLDCVVELNDCKIDIEYDGWFWHQDKERDNRRDGYVKSQGYKVLRIEGNKKDDLPNIELIDIHIKKLLSGNNYTEIIM